MHIAFVASEGVPFSKTGGLADVVGALPRALAALGHQVSVYLPRYRQTKLTDPATVVRSITIPFDDKYRFASVVTGGSQSGVRFYFVECPEYFDRDALYGTPAGDYPDNAERFALVLARRAGSDEDSGRPADFPLPRLAVGAGAGAAAHRVCGGSGVPRRGHGVYHPQHRLSGTVPAGDFAAADAALGSVHHVEDGILWAGEFSERRAYLFRLHYHGEPEIQPGNSDRRIWLWTGRRAARPGRHRHRHFEWRGLRRVESAGG